MIAEHCDLEFVPGDLECESCEDHDYCEQLYWEYYEAEDMEEEEER